MQVALSTRAGFTQPVNVERGVPQGAVTSPEVSCSAQDPILRLRAADGAAYVSSAGRRVTAAGYVDDIEHYGQGLADLPIILNSLEAGSRASGVGFAWSKFSAFASDWDAGLPLLPAGSGVTAAGASVRSWDIWSGGMRAFQLPRSTAQDVDKLLGKRGTPSDRHTLAREDLLAKLASVRQRLSTKCCAWDEITAMTQWVLGGIMGYGPLLGVPSPADLRREDAALHRLLHASLGVRACERVSFSASRSVGGLGAPLVMELLVAAVAADLQVLLNGTSQAAAVARDSLRLALECPPAQLQCHENMLLNALQLLAGYGLYLSLSTDRFICRMLDNLAPPNPHPLHGPYLPSRFQAAARYARCSVTANAVRTAWRRAVAQGIPPSRWGEAIVWRNLLPEHAPVSHSACAAAARKALEQSNSDWLVECSIFHITAHPVPAEEWSNQAWDDPWHSGCDSRSLHLLSPELPGAAHQSHEDQALYGDGGYSPQFGATFCSQARGFGVAGEYWTTSSWASRTLSGRLPARYGWEPSAIHTARRAALWCFTSKKCCSTWGITGPAMRPALLGGSTRNPSRSAGTPLPPLMGDGSSPPASPSSTKASWGWTLKAIRRVPLRPSQSSSKATRSRTKVARPHVACPCRVTSVYPQAGLLLGTRTRGTKSSGLPWTRLFTHNASSRQTGSAGRCPLTTSRTICLPWHSAVSAPLVGAGLNASIAHEDVAALCNGANTDSGPPPAHALSVGPGRAHRATSSWHVKP